ncbi:hypothetical protein DL764_000170 [Monosporascus ibericus]|uniref:Heterokaryon incompatibility domain-containing protein n=1 Tax=Monosporascus ibericus TaxID=155417 RepID=A0A4Q4TX53_9PEZI|nr:hypothetical protein DL764_000170 [Monosporascus ibericus]
MDQNSRTTVLDSKSALRQELAEVEQSNVFSAAMLRSTALGSLVANLQKSFYCYNTPLEENACLGDDGDLCEVCSKIPLTWQTSIWQFSPTGPTAGIALAREVSLGNLRLVMTRTKCAMCRIVTSILLKDDSIILSRNSATLECVLKPGQGAFRTYTDDRYVADVFYGSHAASPLRGHISWQRYRHIPLTTWTVKQPEGESSSTQIMWAQACSRIISHQNSSNQCADFDQIYGWLEKCEEGHDTTCNPKWSKSTPQAGIMIRLVDVVEKRLVPNCLSTEYSYVALSYVWGKSNTGQTTTRNLERRMRRGGLEVEFDTLPAAIRDACSVVEKLGERRPRDNPLRYLWVDSLCIVQDDREDQNSQIPHMDKIYHQSLVTIVALSATGAATRLPGVEPGSRPVPIQRTERTACWILSSIPPTLDRVLKLPCYETRAWTLQERILSNRRLYFSNWQVYFQCYRYVYQEAYDRPRQIVQDGSSMSFQFTPFHVNLSHCSFGFSNTWHIRLLHLNNQSTVIQWNQSSLIMYDQLVAELSGRKLTVADDILKAFAGLVAYMESNQAGPFVAGTPLNVLDRALLWAPTQELKRRVLEPGARRIPSWSWCAWDGQVRYTWGTSGVLSRLLNCDVMSISSWITDFFLEDRGSLRRVDRLAHNLNGPSREVPQGTAADYGIYPLECHPDGGQYLHFETSAVPAADFSIDGGQIRVSEAGGDWDFFLSTDLQTMIESFTHDPWGVFATYVRQIPQANQPPISTVVYRQRNRKEPLPEGDGAHPACWIFDKHGKRCGILFDYEKPMKEFFLRRDCWFILLSVHAKLQGKRVPVVAEARGDRFMLHSQYHNPKGILDYLALYNVLLVKEEGGYMTRVGLAQIEEEVFVKAGPESKSVVLG